MKLYFGISVVLILLVVFGVYWTSSPTYDDLMFFNAKKPAEKPNTPKKPAEKPNTPKKPAEKPNTPKKPAEKPNTPKKPAEKPNTPKKPAGAAANAIANQEALIAKLRKDKSKKDELAAAIKKLKLLQSTSTTGAATQTQIDAQKRKIDDLKQKLKDNPKSKKAKDDLVKATEQLKAMQGTTTTGVGAAATQTQIDAQKRKIDELKQKLKDNPKSKKAKDDLAKATEQLKAMQFDKDAQAQIKAMYDKAEKLNKIAATADPNTTKGKKAIQDAKDATAAADTAAAAYATTRRRYFRWEGGGQGTVPEPLVSVGKLTQKELKAAYLKPGTEETYDGRTFIIRKDGTVESRPCFGTECDSNTIDAGSAMYLANAWARSSGQLKPGEIYKVPTKDGKSTELYTVDGKGDIVPYKNNPKDTKPVTCPIDAPTAPTTGRDPGELRFLAGGSGDKACGRARPSDAINLLATAGAAARALFGRNRGSTPAAGSGNGAPVTMSQLTSLPVTQQHAPASPVVAANREAAAARAAADRAAQTSNSVDAATYAIDAQAAATRLNALSETADEAAKSRYSELEAASAAWANTMNTGQPQSVIDAARASMLDAQEATTAARATAAEVKAAARAAEIAAKKARDDAKKRPNTVNSDIFLDSIPSSIRTYEELQRIYGNIVTREQFDTRDSIDTHIQFNPNDIDSMARYVLSNPTRATASGFYGRGNTVSEAQQTLFDTVQATYANLNQYAEPYRNFERQHPENNRAGIEPDVFALVSAFPRPTGAKSRNETWTALQNYYAGTTFLRDNNITQNNFNAIRSLTSRENLTNPNSQRTYTLTAPPPERPSSGPTLSIGQLYGDLGDRYSEAALLRSARAFRNAGGTYQQYVQAATDMGLTTENGGLASESLFNGRIQR